jgi:uncharacterized membrane protein
MTRRQRIGIIASVLWIVIFLVRGISGPREQFFFVFYIFGAVPIAIGWLIYFVTESKLFR